MADFCPTVFIFKIDGHPGIKKQWEEIIKNKLLKVFSAFKRKG